MFDSTDLFPAAPSGTAGWVLFRPLPLLHRAALLAILFLLEALLLSTWLDTATLRRTVGLTGAVGDWGPPAVRALVVMATVLIGFFFLKPGDRLRQAFVSAPPAPVRWRFLAAHVFAMAGFCAVSASLFGAASAAAGADLLTALWLVSGAIAVPLAVFAFLSAGLCYRLLRASGNLPLYAILAGIAVNPMANAIDRLWNPATALTFSLVRICLAPFFRDVVADPARHILGTPGFNVMINRQCSGLEGAGLMLLFGVFWLWFLRGELRFPRALLVIPAGMAVLYGLNAVRIAALIAIGNAGARSVALGGFHSQAGWIAFNAVALGLLLGVRSVPWLSKAPQRERSSVWEENPAAPYLVPFLAILACAMITRAASAHFEWLYPLRLLAAGAALWCFRRKYAALDWRISWFAPVAGAAAFVLWMALHRLAGVQADNGIGAGLRAAGPAAAGVWLTCRVLAAVASVPLAEELAFRGFPFRAMVERGEAPGGAKGGVFGMLAASSIAFGVMHGSQWIAGIAVGLLYGGVLLRRRRMGDAVVAHATTNALLAAWVLVYRDWSLW